MLPKFLSLQTFIGVFLGVVSVLFFQHFTGAFDANRELPTPAIEGTFAPPSPHTASTGIGKQSEIFQTIFDSGAFSPTPILIFFSFDSGRPWDQQRIISEGDRFLTLQQNDCKCYHASTKKKDDGPHQRCREEQHAGIVVYNRLRDSFDILT